MTPAEQLRDARRRGEGLPFEQFLADEATCRREGWDRAEVSCELLEAALDSDWEAGGDEPTRVESLVDRLVSAGGPPMSRDHLLRLATAEFLARSRAGDSAARDELAQRFDSLRPELDTRFDQAVEQETLANRLTSDPFSTLPSDEQSPAAPAAPAPIPLGIRTPLTGAAEVPAQIGRYRIVRHLGSGGFADVYLAEDSELRRQVAIKSLRRGSRDQAAWEAFLVEAQRAAALRHPGIVTIHDVVQQPDGAGFIVMEYVESSLARLLDQGPLPVARAIEIAIEIAEALAAAHRKGIVHRDLKPANVLIDGRGRCQLADFGLAVHDSTQSQQRGQIAGTPAFMAPEQVRGETQWVDGRTDIWALGVILYQMLSGRLPFTGSVSEIFEQIEQRDPRPPRQLHPELPRELEDVCLRCMSRDRQQRYATADDVVTALQAARRPQRTGVYWEYILVPLGIIVCVIGTLLALVATESLYSSIFETVQQVRWFGLRWFLTVGLTAGVGPPMIVVGKWICCRWQKAGHPEELPPCKVSKFSVLSLAMSLSTLGWGLAGVAATWLVAALAVRELRRRRGWLTGWSYLITASLLAPVLAAPVWIWWSELDKVLETTEKLERAEAHYAAGEYEQASALHAELAGNDEFQLFFVPRQRGWAKALLGRDQAALGDFYTAQTTLTDATFKLGGNAYDRYRARVLWWRAQVVATQQWAEGAAEDQREALRLDPDVASRPDAKLFLGAPIASPADAEPAVPSFPFGPGPRLPADMPPAPAPPPPAPVVDPTA